MSRVIPKRKKIGKCWYVCGFDGKPIIGLSWDKGNGYFYPTEYKQTAEYKKTQKRPNLGKDYNNAIMLFRLWQNKSRQHIEISTLVRKKYSESDQKWFEELYKDIGLDEAPPDECRFYTDYESGQAYEAMGNPDIQVLNHIDLSEDIVIQKTKELFMKYSPAILAEKLGIPSLASIDYSDEVSLPLKLSDIFASYVNQPKFIEQTPECRKEILKVKKAWFEFTKTTKVKYINELTRDVIKKYHKKIFQEYIENNYSTSWINGRYERIRRVFNHSLDQLDDTNLIKVKNRVSSILKKVEDVKKNPAKMFSKPDLTKILSVSTAEEKAMWMVSLNCAYYTDDIASVPMSCIDLQEKTIVFRRSKTGNHRSAVLWDETIQAIVDYHNSSKKIGRTLFVNQQTGIPYHKNTIRKKFVACLERAKMKGKYTHSNFRDSAETACKINQAGESATDALMGHKLKGNRSDYIDPESYPQISEPASKAIHDFYFGDAE